MFFKAIVHDAEEGGFWAEVPALPGCFTQGETKEELLENLKDAIRGCVAVLLEEHGWRVERIEGSHHIMTRPDREETISVPVHGSHSLKIGMIRAILRTAQITPP
jgi:predicted RNase H-like HicB family nuclease